MREPAFSSPRLALYPLETVISVTTTRYIFDTSSWSLTKKGFVGLAGGGAPGPGAKDLRASATDEGAGGVADEEVVLLLLIGLADVCGEVAAGLDADCN